MDTPEQPVTDSAPQSIEDRIAAKFSFGGEDLPTETPQEAQTQGQEQPADATAEQPEGAQQPQDDSEEVEFEGLRLQLPKEAASKLKSTVEGYKDYTKKTQEVAEARRMVDARQNMLQEQQAFQASIAPELSQYQQYDAQIGQYKKLDWAAMSMEDTIRYRAALDQLKDAKDELGQKLQGKQSEFQQKLAQHKRQLAEAQAKAVKLALPKWDDASQKATQEYLLNKGYTPEQLGSNYDPLFVELAFKAHQWDALQASKPNVVERTKNAPPVLKPGPGQQQPSKAIQTMNFRKAIKNAPDKATKHALIMDRLESKI